MSPRLALIVGAARSGTTLLRLLLDAHTEVGCPSEAGLPALMAHMASLWMTVHADVEGQDRGGEDPGLIGGDTGELGKLRDGGTGRRPRAGELPPSARQWIRAAVREPMRRYTERGNKELYVDKSLDSVFHLDLVEELFPETRYILLVRHVMDTVASGIEASPWGFQAYGYGPYVQASPHNSVAALASYWLAHVSAALHWENEHRDDCLRVRYEDLVRRPEETVSSVLRFLDVDVELSVLERAFAREPATGPGDYKVAHTSEVHAHSIGHGKRVPVSMLPPRLLEGLNEKLLALGYERLDRAWNAQERPVDAGRETVWSERLRELMSRGSIAPGVSIDGLGSFALVAEDHRALRWVVDLESGEVSQGDGDVEAVLTGTAEDLVLMLAGEENLGVLLRSGRIRPVAASSEDMPPNLPRTVNRIVAVLAKSARQLPSDIALTDDGVPA